MYQLGVDDLDVVRNNKVDLSVLNKYDKIMISPGPGIPNEAELMRDVIAKSCTSNTIVGSCLGHQAIPENFGGS